MVTRRRFLTNGVGLIALGAAGFVGVRFAMSDTEHLIARIVRHYLGADRLLPGAADAFAADYAPVTTSKWQHHLMWASTLYFVPTVRDALSERRRARLEQYDRLVVTEFLLASDMDPDDRDAERPLSYLGLYTDRACNPFARFVEDTA